MVELRTSGVVNVRRAFVPFPRGGFERGTVVVGTECGRRRSESGGRRMVISQPTFVCLNATWGRVLRRMATIWSAFPTPHRPQ
jgi:hypothetical protein